jgi:hypothetical protein
MNWNVEWAWTNYWILRGQGFSSEAATAQTLGDYRRRLDPTAANPDVESAEVRKLAGELESMQ